MGIGVLAGGEWEGCISGLPGMAAAYAGVGRLLLPWELVEHPLRAPSQESA